MNEARETPVASVASGAGGRDPSRLIAVLILAIGLALLSWNLTAPFTGLHEWNSAMYATFARNHVEYGLDYTKLFCTWGDTATPPEPPERYLNHPPLIALWAAVPAWILGDEEWVFRSVPIAATLGSAWLLMGMMARLGSRRRALLTGLFYVTWPAVAFFGRMLDHVALAQFFSLLMLDGYFRWAGDYAGEQRRGRGVIRFALGAALGVATGWAALLMAGAIWIRHAWRSLRGHGRRSMLAGLTLVPFAALVAVITHILWGSGVDLTHLASLFWRRSMNGQSPGAVPWTAWLLRQWGFLLDNFTVFGVAAMGIVSAVAVVRAVRRVRERRQTPSVPCAAPMLLLAVQGAGYVVAFRNHAWIHDYWQFLLAPFAAIAAATLVDVIAASAARMKPAYGRTALGVLVLLPMPLAVRGLLSYHRKPPFLSPIVDTLDRLGDLVPARVPVMTSWNLPVFSETFGTYTNRWPVPQVAFYAHRPLILTRDLDAILSNPSGCPAYLLQLANDEEHRRLATELGRRFEYVNVFDANWIVLLHRPRRSVE
ncbi:MAG: glycosyltransferase family 39 protein [Phycisphaerae bacterium]|nr:glycosyltransferase family 39 protein [Phycisphaerae bacterium]